MNLTDLNNSVKAHRRRTRKGRGTGSGLGKTCGRGHKGYKSRSGSSARALFEGGQMPLFRRIPKRGFSNALFRKIYIPINVGRLNQFEDGTVVTPELLKENGMVSRYYDGKKYYGIKILGEGELTRKLTVVAHKFSKTAATKIEKAGGAVHIATEIANEETEEAQ